MGTFHGVSLVSILCLLQKYKRKKNDVQDVWKKTYCFCENLRIKFWGKVNANEYCYTWSVIHDRVRCDSTWYCISRTLKKQYGTEYKDHLLGVFVQYTLVYCPITPSSYQPGIERNSNSFSFVSLEQREIIFSVAIVWNKQWIEACWN